MATSGPAIQSEGSSRRPGLGGWICLAPLLAWLLLFVVAPTAILLVCSFSTYTNPGQWEAAFTFDNYREAFTWPYLVIFLRSLHYAGATTALCAIVGYPVAYFIGRSTAGLRNALLVLVMIPFLISFLIRAYAWVIILLDHGILNAALESLRVIPHVFPHRLNLLYSPAAVLIGLVYTYLPFMVMPIYGSVEKLDQSLIDAAGDLGAGPLRTAWSVILPLTWPGVAAGIIMVFVPSVAMFAVTGMMGGGRVWLIGDAIEHQFLSSGNLPLGAALGVLLLALFMLSFLIIQRNRP
jgi:spermidine/putrescine transport system permease protein